jgi:hypothetical protein
MMANGTHFFGSNTTISLPRQDINSVGFCNYKLLLFKLRVQEITVQYCWTFHNTNICAMVKRLYMWYCMYYPTTVILILGTLTPRYIHRKDYAYYSYKATETYLRGAFLHHCQSQGADAVQSQSKSLTAPACYMAGYLMVWPLGNASKVTTGFNSSPVFLCRLNHVLFFHWTLHIFFVPLETMEQHNFNNFQHKYLWLENIENTSSFHGGPVQGLVQRRKPWPDRRRSGCHWGLGFMFTQSCWTGSSQHSHST